MENHLVQTQNGNTSGRQAPAGEFTGLVSLQLADLIQMVCLSRWDLIVRVSSSQGKGTIQIREGRIDHAQTDTLQGDQAFFEMFRWSDGQFEMLPYKASDHNSIGKPWEHLLLEAMRQRDEALSKQAAAAPESEGPTAAADPDLSALEESFDLPGLLAGGTAPDPGTGEPVRPGAEACATRSLKVLVVEDSPFFARQLQKTLEADGDIEITAIAKNGQEALDILSSSAHVDAITLDVEMPVMPGGTALKHIMIRHRIPTVVISAFQPKAMGQIFEYMELGAVDFISKPAAGDDIDRFGKQLRALARKATAAELSHFRRLRKNGPTDSRANQAVQSGRDASDVLLVLGAEGAYVDWLRIPWAQICPGRIVIGLQQLPHPFLSQFCHLIEGRACVQTAAIARRSTLEPGTLYLGNGGGEVELKLSARELALEAVSDVELPWREGIHTWIQQLTDQGRHRLTVLCLSAAYPMAPEWIEHLVNGEARVILPPRECLMLPELRDAIQPYAHLASHQIVVSALENLPEVLTGNE